MLKLSVFLCLLSVAAAFLGPQPPALVQRAGGSSSCSVVGPRILGLNGQVSQRKAAALGPLWAKSSEEEATEKADTLLDVDEADDEDGEVPAAAVSSSAPGKYRRRRQEKAAQKQQLSRELRTKLLEEQASPFRKIRQFLYAACAGSAGIGSFVSGTRVIAGLQGIEGVQPLSETIPNTAINVGVVAVGVGLWIFEERKGQEGIKKLTEKSGIRQMLANLQVQLSSGETVDLQNLRDSTRLVLLAGTASEVTRSINLAARASEGLQKNQVAIVPYFTDLSDDSAGWEAMKESSASGKWDPWLMRPLDREQWSQWLKADREQQLERMGEGKKGSSNIDKFLRCYVIRKDGKIGARTVGPPAWPKLVKQFEALPETDQYGTP